MTNGVESGGVLKSRWNLLGLVALLIFFGLGALDFVINGREARQVRAALEKEMGEIPRPSDAYLVSETATAKPRHVNVGRAYRTTQLPPQIFNHYVKALRERGWLPCGGQSPPDVTRVVYCRGDYAATLSWSHDTSWNYSIEFTWGART